MTAAGHPGQGMAQRPPQRIPGNPHPRHDSGSREIVPPQALVAAKRGPLLTKLDSTLRSAPGPNRPHALSGRHAQLLDLVHSRPAAKEAAPPERRLADSENSKDRLRQGETLRSDLGECPFAAVPMTAAWENCGWEGE